MNPMRRFLLGTSLLAALACAPGCASSDGEGEEDEGALGAEDSGKVIPTTQSDLLLFQGYSTLFDQGHNGCVTFPSTLTPQVGDVGVDVKIDIVRSRDELARQLGFETELGFKLPKAGADARAQVMNSFKRNASTMTLLVRVGSYYFIDAGQSYSLTTEAKDLLQRDPARFLQRCGDAVVTRLQYRAEVIGLMRFDTNDSETATRASGNVGANAPVGTVADAQGKVSGTYERVAQSTRASMNLELYTQGFFAGSNVGVENLQGDQAMARLGELLKNMAASLDADRKRDLQAVADGKLPVQQSGAAPTAGRNVIERHARLSAITFHSYAKNQDVSMAPLTQVTQGAGRFLVEVGEVQGRLENAYFEEVNAFTQARDQETYNLSSASKATLAELEPVAQKWSGLLKPSAPETVSGKLKEAQLECVRQGIAGDFSKCSKTAEIEKLIDDGKKQLDEYGQTGRIVRMNIVYGSTSELTVDRAKDACTRSGGRLPYDTEMEWLRPALTAKGGFAWVMSRACPKSIGIFTGAQEPKCYDGWYMDWYDSLLDATGLSKRAAPVFCVANSGPRAVLPRPGE